MDSMCKQFFTCPGLPRSNTVAGVFAPSFACSIAAVVSSEFPTMSSNEYFASNVRMICLALFSSFVNFEFLIRRELHRRSFQYSIHNNWCYVYNYISLFVRFSYVCLVLLYVFEVLSYAYFHLLQYRL